MNEPDVSLTICPLKGLKTQSFSRMYEFISAFATRKFCHFLKTISSVLLTPWLPEV